MERSAISPGARLARPALTPGPHARPSRPALTPGPHARLARPARTPGPTYRGENPYLRTSLRFKQYAMLPPKATIITTRASHINNK
jgi:hypothetical protein